MALRELALTVLELDEAQFHWVLMEAVEADDDECLVYRPIDSALQPESDFSAALQAGNAVMRAMQLPGLRASSKPVTAPVAA